MPVCLPFPPCARYVQAAAERLTARDAVTARLTCSAWAKCLQLPRIVVRVKEDTGDGTCLRPPALAAALAARSTAVNGVCEAVLVLGSNDGTAAAEGAAAALAAGLPSMTRFGLRSEDAVAPRLEALLPVPRPSRMLLRSLALDLETWPTPPQLAGALSCLAPALTRLELARAPITVLCAGLPSLPQLRELRVTGRLREPVPASYSTAAAYALLPALPQLRLLVLRALPLDLRRQEQEDIEACELAAVVAPAQPQLQQPQPHVEPGQHAPAALTPPPSPAVRAVGVPPQWVGTSIATACPALEHLHTDMELGPALLPLRHLKELHGVHPAWLRAALRAAGPAGARHPQLARLKHLGTGADTHNDCSALAQLRGLRSLALWASGSASPCVRRRRLFDGCKDGKDQPSLDVLLTGGVTDSLTRLELLDAAWTPRSDELKRALSRCGSLHTLCVEGTAVCTGLQRSATAPL